MPPKIAHDDGFEISLSHQNEWLTIYDSVSVSNNSQGEAYKTTTHVGNFTGARNQAFVLRKTGAELLMIQLSIVRNFDFFASNAVQFALHVVTADGDKEQVHLGAILKKTHDKKPKDSTGFPWLAVQGSEAHRGTVLVSVTRGNQDEHSSLFTPLGGEADQPYIVEIEWRSIDDSTKRRVTRGMQHASPTPPPVSRKRPATATKPKPTKSIEQTGGSSSTEKPMEPTRARSSSDQVSPGNQDNNTQPTIEPAADSQKRAAGDADSTQEQSLPAHLNGKDDEANLSQSGGASGSEGAEAFATPSATFIDSDRTPGLDSDTGGATKSSVIGSTPTRAHGNDDIGTPTLKRSAHEAFESDREKDMIRLAFGVDMAKATFDVDDAKTQELTDKSSRKYLGLLLKKAYSHYNVFEAELELKKAQLDGNKDAEYRELKTGTAEARLVVLEAEEQFFSERKDSLDFKVIKAYAVFRVTKAEVKQMAHEGPRDDVQFLQAVLKKAQANSGVALAEFALKAAECGDDKDDEYFQLQTRKAEAHRDAVQAQGEILRKTGVLQ